MRNLALDAVEGATTDKEDILGVDMNKLLLWVLATALWRHINHRTLEQLQQTLLNAFARHIAGDRRVVGFASNLIDFIDKDDTFLGFLDVVLRLLQEACEQTLDIFAHITGLGEDSSIDDGEWHLEEFGNRAS